MDEGKAPIQQILAEAQQELVRLVEIYDGSLPFPEWAERYLQEHPSKYDLSVPIQYIAPVNDPRRQREYIDVEMTCEGKRYRGTLYIQQETKGNVEGE